MRCLQADRRAAAGVGTILLTIVAIAVGMTWLVILFFRYRQGEYVDGTWIYVYGNQWAVDFDAYVGAASRLLAEGTLYQSEALSGPFRHGAPRGLYVYSPVLGVSVLPLTGMSFADSSLLWYVLRVLALLAACTLMPVRPVVRPLAFVVAALSYSVIEDFVVGNVSVLLVLTMVILWRRLDRPAGAVALALALSLRPTLGILLIWQVARRRWRFAAWTLAAGISLILLTLPFVGIGGYLDYLTVLRHVRFDGVVDNRSLSETVLTLGGGTTLAKSASVAGYIVGVAAIVLGLRRDREVGFMVTLTASLLLSPLLWDHYFALLLVPGAFLADRVRPTFILLPLISWLPEALMPFAVVAAVFLPFLARDPEPPPART